MVSSINPFDAVVYALLLIAVVFSFNSGLLRSLATIFGYVAAMALAVAFAPPLTQILVEQFRAPPGQGWVVFVMLFIGGGMLIGVMLRYAVSAAVGPNVSFPDRVAGAMLGAIRILLLAVVIVLVFDRLIPPSRNYGHEQAWHDGNGHSHLQATLLGPSLSVPIREGELVLGTWQQIFHLECDVRPRQRTVVVTVLGE